MKRGCNDSIIEAEVRKQVVQKLDLYLIQHHPKYNIFVLNLPALNDIPEHGIIDYVIILYDEANYDGLTSLLNTGNEYSGRNSNSTVPIPHIQELGNYAIEAQLKKIRHPEQNIPQPRLNWPMIGSQPIDDFNTKGLDSMYFPELFLDGKRDPTMAV